MQHISSEQQQITQEMTKLQADFKKDSAAAAKDFPRAAESGQKIAEEIGRRQIPSLMGQAHGQFAQQNGPPGFGTAKQAFEQMNAMMSAAGSCQSAGQGELDIALTKSLGQSGLGQKLGQDMSDSANRGNGQNPGEGTGSKAGNKKGQADGGANSQPHAYVMKTDSIHSLAGVKKSKSSNRPASQAELSPDSVEMMKSSAVKPPKATDASTAGYPPEYRKMINDYFTSVSKEKR